VLADEAAWKLVIKDEAGLAGLPDALRAAARQAAAERGIEDAWVITLSRSLVEPFLASSARGDLREQVWKAFDARGEAGAERENCPLIQEMVALRLELARLHGYSNYADYALVDRMARTPQGVAGLLERLWPAALARVSREKAGLQALADSRGETAPLQPWDWRYWEEELRKRDYQLDDAETKPYFQLDAMLAAMFECAGRLFGVEFVEKTGIPLYHPDVRLWELREAGGALKGIFLADNFARPTKRSGAWMSNYRDQTRNSAAGAVIPIVVNNNNFAKGEAGTPTLLSFDDVTTLFHEFGHGLHGLLSDATWQRLSGTNVLTDFVELPSQLFEHWALEPGVLARHARHWRTGAAIPDALIKKIKACRTYGQGFKTVQYLGPALIDMALHCQVDVSGLDPAAFEAEQRRRLGVPDEVGLRHRLPHFLHLFSDDQYAAGYYVYIWAEVLDADAWQAFVEAGDPFDPAVADRLKRYIYAAGNSREPGEAYRLFRGRDAEIGPLLAQRGLV
jgi:peptidyl-dipeptidase Dcp